LLFAAFLTASHPLVALFCRLNGVAGFCATSPFAPKNLVASTHLTAHHHQEDQPGQRQVASSEQGVSLAFLRPAPASHLLVALFCRLKGVAGFCATPPFAQKSFATSTPPPSTAHESRSKGVGARGWSKGGRPCFCAREPASHPLVVLFCRQQRGRRFCPACPFALPTSATSRPAPPQASPRQYH
jgi:hypothetical protein